MTMLQAKPIAIVGGSHTFEEAPFDNLSVDILAFNGRGRFYPRVTVVMDIHSKERQAQDEGRLEWLQNASIPIYTDRVREDIPTSIVYPYKEAFALTEHMLHRGERLKYFTSSFAWAIALAILQERPKIEIYGIEMTATLEYKKQRSCFAFWTGFAGGRGIDIEINCADKIFRRPLYWDKENYS